jgi:site-specific recombinase XerD
MASISKPKGKTRYVILYHDETGRRRKKVGTTDKTVAQRIARDLEKRVALRREGVIDAKADALANHEARPLADHLADWRKDMEARGKTPKHAVQYHERAGKLAALVRGTRLADLERGRKPEARERAARKLADALKTARLSDLAPEKIQSALALLRDAGKSNQTVNHYRAALRAFARWAGDKGRLRDNPMRGVKGFNAEEDVRHERRALTDDELARLIATAGRGPELFGMPGPLRAMAYRVASATGFRAEELRTLTAEVFHLNVPEPTVYLQASATKNRRPADQPIPVSLARDLAVWLRELPSGTPVFPLHHETAKAIRTDLEAAGIPYQTDEGVADFHSLRAYYVSALVRSGASIKEVQALARHPKPETTFKHYAKVSAHDLHGAVECLPVPFLCDQKALIATGTDPTPNATQSATCPDPGNQKPFLGKGVTSSGYRIAKPLGRETGLGGSNPPLSAKEPSGTDRTRPNPSDAGVSGVSAFWARMTADPPGADGSRPEPSPPVGK